MKILMLNYEFPPLGGGQANANYYLYEALKKIDCPFQIDILTSSIDKKKQEKSDLGTIYYLNIGKKGNNLQAQSSKDLIIFCIKAFLVAIRLIFKEKYSLIVAWGGVPSGILAMMLRLFLSKPYITLLRGSDVPFSTKKWHTIDKYVFSWLAPIMWKYAARMITNCEMLKTEALRLSPSRRFDVIYNGIDTEKFKPNLDKKANTKIKIISVGRLHEIKNYDNLIKSIKDLPNSELTLIGEGRQEQELKKLAKELNLNVNFVGRKSQEEIVCYLQNADIFVLPSLHEGMSNSILEAMACGLPIIATNVGGSKELVQENGFIIEKESVSAIIEALQKYEKKPELIRIHAQKSREKALSMTWENIAKQSIDVYQSVL